MKANSIICSALGIIMFLTTCCFGQVACPNCSKWEDKKYHDAQVTKGGRCKTGTIPKGCVPVVNKSEDRCLRCQVTVRYNTPSGYRRCPMCFGKGEIADKNGRPKEDPKTTSSSNNPVQEKQETKPTESQSVVLVDVKKCDKCDENGKVVPIIDCALCENGVNHKKDGDTYKCRVCGKACKSRFAPCCMPDCPECGEKRGGKSECPFCGGDKVITPMEEARNKAKTAPVNMTQ